MIYFVTDVMFAGMSYCFYFNQSTQCWGLDVKIDWAKICQYELHAEKFTGI